MNELTQFLFKNMLRAWDRNAGHTRGFIVFAAFAVVAGGLVAWLADSQQLAKELAYAGFLVTGLGLLMLALIAAREQLRASERVEQEIRSVQEKARANPENPEFAWDLARTKLERYLDRNLYEARAIFFLTTLVMLGGFALVTYGLLRAYADAASLPVSIVSAASGILLSFIGGSFMLIYRSVLAQSASYVAILERINAVGMAVQIASTVVDGDGKLKAQTTAALAQSLLTMYGTSKR